MSILTVLSLILMLGCYSFRVALGRSVLAKNQMKMSPFLVRLMEEVLCSNCASSIFVIAETNCTDSGFETNPYQNCQYNFPIGTN